MAVAIAGLALTCSAGASAPYWKAWLCFPGAAKDWCAVDLTTTVFPANGSHRNVEVSVPSDPPVDCFYLYPR